MILLYPLLLLAALGLARRSRARTGGKGVTWFLWWTLAGFLLSFSLITGLSIGLFILPFAAVALLTAARLSPHLPEGTGFLVGAAATAIVVTALHA